MWVTTFLCKIQKTEINSQSYTCFIQRSQQGIRCYYSPHTLSFTYWFKRHRLETSASSYQISFFRLFNSWARHMFSSMSKDAKFFHRTPHHQSWSLRGSEGLIGVPVHFLWVPYLLLLPAFCLQAMVAETGEIPSPRSLNQLR